MRVNRRRQGAAAEIVRAAAREEDDRVRIEFDRPLVACSCEKAPRDNVVTADYISPGLEVLAVSGRQP